MVKVRLEFPIGQPLEDEFQTVPSKGDFVAVRPGGDHLVHFEVEAVIHSKQIVRLVLKHPDNEDARPYLVG